MSSPTRSSPYRAEHVPTDGLLQQHTSDFPQFPNAISLRGPSGVFKTRLQSVPSAVYARRETEHNRALSSNFPTTQLAEITRAFDKRTSRLQQLETEALEWQLERLKYRDELLRLQSMFEKQQSDNGKVFELQSEVIALQTELTRLQTQLEDCMAEAQSSRSAFHESEVELNRLKESLKTKQDGWNLCQYNYDVRLNNAIAELEEVRRILHDTEEERREYQENVEREKLAGDELRDSLEEQLNSALAHVDDTHVAMADIEEKLKQSYEETQNEILITDSLRKELRMKDSEVMNAKVARHDAINQLESALIQTATAQSTAAECDQALQKLQLYVNELVKTREYLEEHMHELEDHLCKEREEHARASTETNREHLVAQTETIHQIKTLETQLSQSQQAQFKAVAQLSLLDEKLRDQDTRAMIQNQKSNTTINDLNELLKSTRIQLEHITERYQLLQTQAQVFESQLVSVQKDAEQRIQSLKMVADMATSRAIGFETRTIQLEAAQAGSLDQALARCAKAEAENVQLREMHHLERCNAQRLLAQLQELKGNIRVVARVRAGELSSSLQLTLSSVVLREPVTDYASRTTFREHLFDFDRVFGPDTPNGALFDEIEYLVRGCLEGSRGCVFAYGQTGSGKTWTMCATDGLIPRALALVLESGPDRVEIECIEIYNETVVDLLYRGSTPPKVMIQTIPQTGKIGLVGAKRMSVSSVAEAQRVLDLAAGQRSVASTKANARSSRSHCVVVIHVMRMGHMGVLNLVDLAGSERLSQTQTTGDRLKETQAINRSLSCLGDVINALMLRNMTHIPFRNSKLTHLLQDSLSGTAKAVMLVSLAPEERHIGETLGSLRFAAKVEKARIRR